MENAKGKRRLTHRRTDGHTDRQTDEETEARMCHGFHCSLNTHSFHGAGHKGAHTHTETVEGPDCCHSGQPHRVTQSAYVSSRRTYTNTHRHTHQHRGKSKALRKSVGKVSHRENQNYAHNQKGAAFHSTLCVSVCPVICMPIPVCVCVCV